MIRSVLTAVVLVSALVAGQSAQAQTTNLNQREATALHVQVRDSELTSPAKLRGVYSRLAAAAHAACQSEVSDPQTQNDDRACEARVLSDAINQLNQPSLSLLNTQNTDKDARTAVARND